MFIGTDELGEVVKSVPVPVLFLDTCTILDIMRAPFREAIAVEEISAAINLIQMAENNPPSVWLVTNETVAGEWSANRDNVKTELEREVKKSERLRLKMLSAVDIILGLKHDAGHKIEYLKMSEHLENLSSKLLQTCKTVKIEDVHSLKAMNRVRKYIAPACRGKQEAKDCEIFEAFIDVCSTVRSKGVTAPVCFVTANSDDYGKPTDPKPPLDSELTTVGGKYIGSLSWALAVVQGRA